VLSSDGISSRQNRNPVVKAMIKANRRF